VIAKTKIANVIVKKNTIANVIVNVIARKKDDFNSQQKSKKIS